uniref:NADH-ubiquinone oxidoreductase chain 2 n=1 Tax=Lethocerus indicus TaxID=212017 RepID=A0A0N7ALZ9_LETIN|nr:NADH dehydrogenase subunit 2 [Lethocerus indicus]AJG02885.1 NADH dehydrogenase subunit 2 [Lethocerus indicus]
MASNSSKLMFTAIMILGTLTTINASNWLGIWMGLEINLIAFTPLIFKPKQTTMSEASMIYFLVQSLGSAMMLMIIVTNNLMMEPVSSINNSTATALAASLMLKLGMAPMHMWFPEVTSKMSWQSALLLLTWQKIAPLVVLSYVVEKSLVIYILVMTSTFIGAVGGLNQTSLRKIMAYSSISHMGWMVACMKMENNMWIAYLVIYITMVTMAIILFEKTSMYHINQVNINTLAPMEKFMYMSLFMSLGGLPPFLGFLPKWIVIQSLMGHSLYMVLTVMVLTTLITLLYYLRMMTMMSTINTSMNKWITEFKPPHKNLVMIVLAVNLSTPIVAVFMFM